MQRIVFDPSTSVDVAVTVMRENADVRNQLVELVAGATAPALGTTAAELGPAIDQTLSIPEGAALTTGILSDAHARLVGARDEPVQITGVEMVQLTRNQVVATVPAVTLPIEPISWLSTVRGVLSWFVPIAAVIGVAALILGIVAHPRRADAVFGIGVFCILAALLGGVLGYVVPAFVLPLLNDDAWMAVVPAVANDQLPLIAGTSVALAVIGVILLIGATGAGRRKPKSWSSPVGTGRYADQRHWS